MTNPTPDDTTDPDIKARLAQIDLETKELALDKARQDAAASRLAALVPDLGTVKDSTLEVTGSPVRSATLAYQAMRKAAVQVAADLPAAGPEQVVLVTSDPDLATRTGTYDDVVAAVDALESAARVSLADPAVRPATKPDRRDLGVAVVGAGLSLAAKALPGVLSLLSAKRTVATTAVTADDLAACAEVIREARRLQKGGRYLHDDFRMVPRGALADRVAALSVTREELVARASELDALTDPTEVQAEQKKLCQATAAAIADFLLLVRTVPTGQKRSLLSTAGLVELLYDAVKPTPWVLLVRSNGGTATQVTDNQPFVFADKVFVMVEVAITYLLIDTDDSQVACSGAASGVATARGKIDRDLMIT